MKLIARLKRHCSNMGLPLDVTRFALDRNYARWALTQFTAAADEEEIVLALQIMSRLKLTARVPPPRSMVRGTASYPGAELVPDSTPS